MSDDEEQKRCAGCLKEILSDRRAMRCYLCEKYYDLPCCGLTDAQYKKFNMTSKTTWKCPTCQARLRSGGDNSNTPIRMNKPADERQDLEAHITDTANRLISSSIESVIRDLLIRELEPIKSELAILSEIRSSIKNVTSEIEDIKKCLASLREENKTLKKDNEELKNSVKEHSSRLIGQDQKITKMKEEIKEMEKSVEFAANQYDEINEKIKNGEVDSKTCSQRTQKLNDAIEELERLTNQNKMELRNVPVLGKETQDELINHIRRLHEAVKLPFSTESIQNVYRLPGKLDKPRSIVIELRSALLKERLLKAVKNYNLVNKDNMLNTTHVGIVEQTRPIYVADYLSNKTKKLYFLARQIAKERNFKYCWTKNGKIFLRKDDVSRLILIKDESSIVDLKNRVD